MKIYNVIAITLIYSLASLCGEINLIKDMCCPTSKIDTIKDQVFAYHEKHGKFPTTLQLKEYNKNSTYLVGNIPMTNILNSAFWDYEVLPIGDDSVRISGTIKPKTSFVCELGYTYRFNNQSIVSLKEGDFISFTYHKHNVYKSSRTFSNKGFTGFLHLGEKDYEYGSKESDEIQQLYIHVNSLYYIMDDIMKLFQTAKYRLQGGEIPTKQNIFNYRLHSTRPFWKTELIGSTAETFHFKFTLSPHVLINIPDVKVKDGTSFSVKEGDYLILYMDGSLSYSNLYMERLFTDIFKHKFPDKKITFDQKFD